MNTKDLEKHIEKLAKQARETNKDKDLAEHYCRYGAEAMLPIIKIQQEALGLILKKNAAYNYCYENFEMAQIADQALAKVEEMIGE